MARRKRKLEAIEALDRSGKRQPFPPEAIEEIKDTINSAWKNRSEKITETRSLAEIVCEIENDNNKSSERKEFEIRIAHIADRITHRRR